MSDDLIPAFRHRRLNISASGVLCANSENRRREWKRQCRRKSLDRRRQCAVATCVSTGHRPKGGRGRGERPPASHVSAIPRQADRANARSWSGGTPRAGSARLNQRLMSVVTAYSPLASTFSILSVKSWHRWGGRPGGETLGGCTK